MFVGVYITFSVLWLSQDGRLVCSPDDPFVVTKTEVIYHTGKPGDVAADIKAGDLLNDKIAEIQSGDQGYGRKEILLKCKVPGCTFNLAASQHITKHFKIRGQLKHGKRPNIALSSPFKIGRSEAYFGVYEYSNYNGDFYVENVNFVASGKAAQSHIQIIGQTDVAKDPEAPGGECAIVFNKVGFLGHNVGFANGGAVLIQESHNSQCLIDIINSNFAHNTAKKGGAIAIIMKGVDAVVPGYLRLTNNKFTDNQAIESGGAIYLENVARKLEYGSDARIMDTKKMSKDASHNWMSMSQENWDSKMSEYMEEPSYFTDKPSKVCYAHFAGNEFKNNKANKKGDTFVGRGGAIYAEHSCLFLDDTRTHGGNEAKFGNFLYADSTFVSVERFGCYQSVARPHIPSYGYSDYQSSIIPGCAASSYDTYAAKEDFYARDHSSIAVTKIDLPGGITCEESSASSTVTRYGCGSHIYAYHCQYGSEETVGVDDHYVEAEDYDRDGFDCRYDCNDVWSTINPAAGEQCNKTLPFSDIIEPRSGMPLEENGSGLPAFLTELFIILGSPDVGVDSNCNGLRNEFIDMDGDKVADWYDQCPYDYWKIVPGKCGCGYEETEGCVQTGASGECTTVEDGGVWYYMCEGDWWYWDNADWVYGGSY